MYYLGIDISKSKIDCALLNQNLEILLEQEVKNTDLSIEKFLLQLLSKQKIKSDELLICCENTGIYNRTLERVSCKLELDLWVEQALKIKRATTDFRGKDDRKDAIRIAQYAKRYEDRKVSFSEVPETISTLTHLVKARESLLKQSNGLKNQLREAKSHDKFEYEILSSSYKGVLQKIAKELKQIEVKIQGIANKDQALKKNVELIQTIPGIGKQTAIHFAIATRNFTLFKSAKHLACYAGVVPFKNESGTIQKKARVSKMADLKLKSLLHLAAMAAVRGNNELKEYFKRKVVEGKNKMSVLNAVRNKLVHRMMSVIQRGEPYIIQQEIFLSKIENACFLT